jgi:hypothetical protein
MLTTPDMFDVLHHSASRTCWEGPLLSMMHHDSRGTETRSGFGDPALPIRWRRSHGCPERLPIDVLDGRIFESFFIPPILERFRSRGMLT